MVLALIMRLFTGEAGILFARLKRLAALYVMMAILGLMVIVFLMMALHTWLAIHVGPIEASLIFAGVFLFLVLVTFILARIAGRKPANRADDRLQRDIASIAGIAALSNAPQLMRVVRQKRGLVIVPAAAAGFLGLYGVLSLLRRR